MHIKPKEPMFFKIFIFSIIIMLTGCSRLYYNFYGHPVKNGYNPISVEYNLNSFTDYFKNTNIETLIHINASDYNQPSNDDSLYNIIVYLDIDDKLEFKPKDSINLHNFKITNFSISCFSSINPQIKNKIGVDRDEKYISLHSTSYEEGWITFVFGDNLIPIMCKNINVSYAIEYMDVDTVITESVSFSLERIAGHTWGLAGWLVGQ